MTEPTITAFSVAFSDALRGFMTERRVTLRDLAEKLDRSLGYVSERTGGVRPTDTDTLDAVAELVGIRPDELIGEIARRMGAAAVPGGPMPGGGAGRQAVDRGRARRRTAQRGSGSNQSGPEGVIPEEREA